MKNNSLILVFLLSSNIAFCASENDPMEIDESGDFSDSDEENKAPSRRDIFYKLKEQLNDAAIQNDKDAQEKILAQIKALENEAQIHDATLYRSIAGFFHRLNKQ